jgi:hypothetical protein
VAVPFIQPSFGSGELAPSLYGRVDLAREHIGLATCRNAFISYRGGAYSRAGTEFILFSKQTGRAYPPRLIPFQFNINQGLALEFGNLYMRVIQDGGYVLETGYAISAATRADPCALTAAGNNFSAGDWVQVTGVSGMTQLNEQTYVVGTTSGGGVFTLEDVFGNPINSVTFTPYSGGGTVARIYTLTTPYAEADIYAIKWTQSEDIMSICCWNQISGTIYEFQELIRHSNTNWTIAPPQIAETIGPPTGVTVNVSGGTGSSTQYSYVVTAVNAADGSESVASVAGTATGGDIATAQGNVGISWTAPASGTVNYYNVYKASPADGTGPTGPWGFITNTTATSYNDTNDVPDFQQVPPSNTNPFSAGGNTYPSVVSYYQQRRVYAGSPNQPETYWFSQPGSFTNFDVRIPTIPSDAITGTPWAVQVDGIQWMIPMPGGLVVLTGSSAWQLTGAGGSALNPQPITPASQQAQPQAFNGAHFHTPPIKIEYDILYVQSKGSIVRDLAYNYWINIYTGQDITQLSSHLFIGYSIEEWAWSEEPYKVIWAVRTDGILLSLTYLKVQEVQAWARHDTQGFFRTVCSVTEPPVDAIYLGVERFIGPDNSSAYTIERMDNRIWTQATDCWCVDCALQLPQSTPNATLYATFPLGQPSSVSGLVSGQGYSPSTTATIIDPTGTGCIVTLTIDPIAGGITAVSFSGGTGYTAPTLDIIDPSAMGRGFSAQIVLNNSATWTTDNPVFSISNVGDVIRAGGGVATIIQYQSPTSVDVNITQPVQQVIPGTMTPPPFLSATAITNGPQQVSPYGPWTMTAPVTTVGGLTHLVGQTVTGLADGEIIPPTVVSPQGTITLAAPATAIVVGLGFQVQIQSLYFNSPASPTDQGQRKVISAVTARIEASRDIKIGSNQIDGPAQNPPIIAPLWQGMQVAPNLGTPAYGSNLVPLYTGDVRIPVMGGVSKPGQVALQQDNPVPLNLLAFVSELVPGDTPSFSMPEEERNGRQRRAA